MKEEVNYVWKRVGGLGCKVCIACSDHRDWRMAVCDEADDDGWAISNKETCANAGNIGLKFVCGPDSSEGYPIAKYDKENDDKARSNYFFDIGTDLEKWPFDYHEDSAVLDKNKD